MDIIITIKHDIRPISIIADTYGRIVVKYADEVSVNSFISQVINVIGTGIFRFYCSIDDVTAEVAIELNNVKLLSYEDADGAIINVDTIDTSQRVEYPICDPHLVTNPTEKLFLIAVFNIVQRLTNADYANFRLLAREISILLLSKPNLIALANTTFSIPIVYNYVAYNDSPDSEFFNSSEYGIFDWHIEQIVTSDQIILALSRQEFISSAAIIIQGKAVTVSDIIVANLKRINSVYEGYVLSLEQLALLNLDESHEYTFSLFSEAKLVQIAKVLTKAVLPLVRAIMQHYNYMDSE